MEYLIQRYLNNELDIKQLTEYLDLSTRQQQYLNTEYSNYTTGEYRNVDLNEVINRICKFLNNIR